MAQVPNIENLTLNPVEVADLREVIAAAVYQSPDFLKFHEVVDGMDKKTQILLDDSAGKAGWKATGCAPIASGGMDIKLSQLYWETQLIEDTLEFCQAELNANFKPLVNKNAKDRFGALEEQEAINVFVKAKVEEYLKDALERFIWLGNTEAKNLTDGGNVVDTVNVKFYTAIDGIWAQAMAAVTAGTTPHLNITRNEQATKALQLALTDAEAFAIVKGVYDNASPILKSDPNAYIRVTPAVYHGYKNYITSGEFANGGFSEKVINGLSTVAYQGVPVFTSLLESKYILEDFVVSNGGSPEVLTYDFPHRAIMASPSLTPVATINQDDFGTLEQFYVQKERKSYVRFDFAIDAKVVRPDLISVAY